MIRFKFGYVENPNIFKSFCFGKFADKINVTEDGHVEVTEETFDEIMRTKRYAKYIDQKSVENYGSN